MVFQTLRFVLIILAIKSAQSTQPEIKPDDSGEDSEAEVKTQGDLKKLGTFSTEPYFALDSNKNAPKRLIKHIKLESRKTSAYLDHFNDPLWSRQWYLQDYRTVEGPVMDHNVVPVYKRGITGKGVIVGVVDCGVDGTHPDLAANYLRYLSVDYVNNSPRGSRPRVRSAHGTKSAGVIAMVADNSECGAGIAYNAKVAGITAIGAGSTEESTMRALMHRLDKIHIYSNSWNSLNEGKEMTDAFFNNGAIENGINKGRGGKGAIYIFSAGNDAEAPHFDNCAADGVVNSPFAITIAAANQFGKKTLYSESCSNVFATAYSSDNSINAEGIVSIALNRQCTKDFGYTSAATAVASGIIALVLEANPDLTYRDVMHLIVMGSEVAPLVDNVQNWVINGAGFIVSNTFGFGLLNAENMVDLALEWENVPTKDVCVVGVNIDKKFTFNLHGRYEFEFDTDGCQGTNEDGELEGVFYLEHIQLDTTIEQLVQVERGDMSIKITSPENTETMLMEPRAMDRTKEGFTEWRVTSKNTWGEDPRGDWKIEIELHDFETKWPELAKKKSNNGKSGRGVLQKKNNNGKSGRGEPPKKEPMSGYVRGFTLTMHGTTEKPAHYREERPFRKYSDYVTSKLRK